jgi:uncharacterized protein (TIGR00255 family)
MSVYSMTGYAGATVNHPSAPDSGSSTDVAAPRSSPAAGRVSVQVELRSVNSRFLDLVFRLPEEWRALEPPLRELLGKSLKRGKVELRLSSRTEADTDWPQPSMEQLNRLARLEGAVQSWLPKAAHLTVNEALHWCQSGGVAALPAEDTVLQAARQAVAELLKSRASEGSKLVAVLMDRVDKLRVLADQAEPLVPAAVERQQQKFIVRWREALDLSKATQTVTAEALQERALNEAAAFAIRVDIAEELARLRAHLDEIARLLKKGGEVGKRLDFLIQELLREANTLASKAASIELTNVGVEMKVLIEQLREQVQNLE